MIQIMEITGPMSGEKKVLIQDEQNALILGATAQKELLQWFKENLPEIWQEVSP